MEPTATQIQVPGKTQYHTNDNDSTIKFTGLSTDVAPPLHRYPNRSILKQTANHFATVTPNAIFYPIKLQMNTAIHPETVFAQEYRHLFKGDEKMV